jgi:hypothetical protein
VTDDKIYFVLIDKDTFKPTIENVMYNFTNCDQMMFGPRVRNGITFKQNFVGFTVWKRRFFHNFKVQISDKNFEGAVGCNLAKHSSYVIGIHKEIVIYDDKNNKAT